VAALSVDDVVEVSIERVAHGGHCVGRYEGQVLFVRHTAPGELIRAKITSVGKGGKFLFADCVEVLQASSERIEAPCRFAGECGGCDFQHLGLKYQRDMKTQVLTEQLTRLGKMSADNPLLQSLQVLPLSESETGLNWRTRMEYATDARGRIGLRRHSSNDVISIDRCLVAADEIATDGITNRPWAANTEVRAVVTSTGERQIVVEGIDDNPILRETVGDHTFSVFTRGFWQAHREAPRVFTESVLKLAALKSGDHVIDLFAGAGLFAVPAVAAVGAGGRVDAVEGNPAACKNLRSNLRNYPNAAAHVGSVDTWLAKSGVGRCDVVIVDPPRVGAGNEVVTRITKLKPRTVVYVACDPAALARDVAYFAELGYEPTAIEAFDAFPMSHHFETVVAFTR
jgi:tRNA/tmRNA/rRNA uracil-C5-methylase (TrmA/RlmC/RlmD family)